MFFMSEDVVGIGLFEDVLVFLVKLLTVLNWFCIYFRVRAMLCSLADLKLAVLWGPEFQTCANRPYFLLLPLEKNSVQGIEPSGFQMVDGRQPLCYIHSTDC